LGSCLGKESAMSALQDTSLRLPVHGGLSHEDPSRGPAEFDALLAPMLGAYWSAVARSAAVPAISVRPLFAFYARLFVWGFCLYAWPLVKLGDWTIRPLWQRATGRTRTRWISGIQARLVAPFSAVHRGEINAFGCIILRALVRLLLYYRLRRRLDAIGRHLRAQRLERFIEQRDASATAGSTAWFDGHLALLKDGIQAIGDKTGFALIVSLVGIGAPLAAIAKLADMIPAATRHQWAATLQALLAHGPFSRMMPAPDDASSSTAVTMVTSALQIIFWLVATNWIAARRLIAAEGVREREAALFRRFGIALSQEIPLDLIGAILFVLVSTVPVLFEFIRFDRTGQDVLTQAWWLLGAVALYLALPVYALVRRVRFHTDDAAPASAPVVTSAAARPAPRPLA
jgi:hypothetical protein